MKEGDEYQFRVIAVNDVGPSEPSRPSGNVLIEEQANKPCMDLGALRDITVRAGEDFSIHVPYVAFPKPTASWFANDTLLDDSDTRVHQQVLFLYLIWKYICVMILKYNASIYEVISWEFMLGLNQHNKILLIVKSAVIKT